LERELAQFTEPIKGLVQRFLQGQDRLLRRFDAFLQPNLGGMRIRTHGDYHLRQLLFTGNDFIIIDFEGRPDRTLDDRRLKRSPLRDVAAMIRSLDYAAASVLLGLTTAAGQVHGFIRDEDRAVLQPWADWWVDYVASVFVQAYLQNMENTDLLPGKSGCRELLQLCILENAIWEMDYELTNRPTWFLIPLRSVLRILGLS
jgi:maltose alpha-D-glucosyltransferase/alpha-amylase